MPQAPASLPCSPPSSWDLEVDAVRVGSGLGSVTAALAAHDRGKSVVILEKSPTLGGLCAYGGGELFCPNGPHRKDIGQADSDDDDDPEAPGSNTGRYLAVQIFDGASLGGSSRTDRNRR